MNGRRVGACGALVAGLLGVAACGLGLTGLENVESGTEGDATVKDAAGDAPAEQDVPAPDTSTVETGSANTGDAGYDAHPDVVIGVDGPGDACETLEICNNGIDDDCNGLVDCADPQCQEQGWACAPMVPPGWNLVAYDGTGRPSCASGWGSSAPLVEAPIAGGTACVCSCGSALTNPCDEGTATLSLGQSACGCAQVQNVPLVADGGCNSIGIAIGQPCGTWGDGNIKPIGLGSMPQPMACAEDPQRPPITYAAQGESCTAQGGAGAGCASGGGCLPAPEPAIACIEAAGIQSCPSGFVHQHVVYSPSNVIDERQCGSCGCTATPTACSGASVTLYDDPGCTQNPVTLTADGKCDALLGDPTDAGWFRYAAALSATSCSGAATTSLDGGLLLRAPATIRCP